MTHHKLRIAIDANEANTQHRVGSNVYAFEIITALYQLTQTNQNLSFTILLSRAPVGDLPLPRSGWRYQVIGPRRFWTQFAEPIYLFLNHHQIDVLFTPGHYAPRFSSVPYISSVMDLAYLKYPDHFDENDLIQLQHWTKYSVKGASKVVAISHSTKNDVANYYQKNMDDIVVAYPAVTPTQPASAQQTKRFFRSHQIKQPYFLFLGTLQPRKNLIRLVEAYEQLCRRLSSEQLKKNNKDNVLPQLVLAGKVGWLAEPLMTRIEESTFSKNIILTGYIPDNIKPALYEQATASLLLGLHEGFGIPPLESLYYNCIPIVSNTTSLPEVVGAAGYQVDPDDLKKISLTMAKALKLTVKNKAMLKHRGKEQLKKFNWQNSAQIILDAIKEVADAHS